MTYPKNLSADEFSALPHHPTGLWLRLASAEFQKGSFDDVCHAVMSFGTHRELRRTHTATDAMITSNALAGSGTV